MTDPRIALHCNGRAWKWLRQRTTDPGIRAALAPDTVDLQPVGNGDRVHFTLTRLQAEETISLLEDLENLRATGSLPPGEIGHDELTFTNASGDLRQGVTEA